jgi:phosphatidylinositol glycan class W
MDLGVGSFVFSQGIVSAIPLIKDPAYLTSSIVSKLLRETRKSFPIIVLGLIRVILVKGSDYPVNYSFDLFSSFFPKSLFSGT